VGARCLREADGVVLQLSESIGREVVEIIVGEVVLSICVASHTARSSSGAVRLLTLL
jgi:hypothetical protein